MAEAFKAIWQRLQDGYTSFLQEVKRLFKASPSTAVLVFIGETALGLVVMLELLIVAHLVDALIGARSIRVFTSDVTNGIAYQIVLFLGLLPVLILHHQWKGVAARIGTLFRRAAFVTSMFLLALPVAPIMLFLVLVGAYAMEGVKKRWAHWLFSLAVMGFAGYQSYKLVRIAVYQGVTVGQVFLIGGALFALTGFLALRPYLTPKT